MSDKHVFSGKFIAPLYMGSALNPINSTLIATALVSIAAFLKIPAAQSTILVSALYLASAIAQPTAGKLAEEFGPRRIFLSGIIFVLAGGIIGGFGQNLPTLVVSRVFIGLGTSTAYPSAMILIRRRADRAGMAEPPNKVLGALQITAAVTSVIGLPLGGILAGLWGWRTAFFVNVPFAGATLAMVLLWLPPDERIKGARPLKDIFSSIDAIGITAFAAMMVAMLVFLMCLPRLNWFPLILAILSGVFMVWWELRQRRPFIDIRLMAKNTALSFTYIRLASLTLCIYTLLYGLSQWLEVAQNLKSSITGLLLLPTSAVSIAVAALVSRKNLIRGPLIVAASFSIAASACLLFLTAGSSIAFVTAITLLFGVTMGTMIIGNQTALYKAVPADQIGTASGLLRTAGYVGSIASSALISVAFRKSVSDSGLHYIAVIMIALSVLALLLSVGKSTDGIVRRKTPVPNQSDNLY